jgi:hypothetical protein
MLSIFNYTSLTYLYWIYKHYYIITYIPYILYVLSYIRLLRRNDGSNFHSKQKNKKVVFDNTYVMIQYETDSKDDIVVLQ